MKSWMYISLKKELNVYDDASFYIPVSFKNITINYYKALTQA
jgi:hypothetical protein